MSDTFQPHATTILAVRRGTSIALGGDGQVTLGNTVMKANARKVRKLFNGTVLAGFAGGTADAFTLFERFEGKLEKFGNLTRAAIELAKDWRTDRYLRRLEALLLVGDPKSLFIISGSGDVIEPEHAAAAIGSGGPYAQAAARAGRKRTSPASRSCGTRGKVSRTHRPPSVGTAAGNFERRDLHRIRPSIRAISSWSWVPG